MKKIILLSLLAFSTALVSCNKETTQENSGKTGTVAISVSGVNTRAATDRVTDGEPITLKPGYIFFADATGVIVRMVEIKNGANAGNENEIELSDLTGGNPVTVENVLTSAFRCYVLTNLPASTLPNVTVGTTNMSTVLAATMHVNSLADINGGVANVAQSGVGIVDNTTTPMKVNVQVYAMGARLQVAKITGYNDIVSYKLDGIFVNNYFVNMPLGYQLDIADLVNNGSAEEVYKGGSTVYAGLNLSDYNKGALASISGTAAVPQGGKNVWAYNIWPTEGLDIPDQPAAMPRLIFVLSDVVYHDTGTGNNETIPDLRYLTIKGMQSNGIAINVIAKGNSYTFTDIRFQYSDLTTVPDVDAVETEVKVQMMPWKETIVEKPL